MAWQSLSISLAGKPRVLAGPVLRKVTPNSVSVWLVTHIPAAVTLKVLDADGAQVLTGDRHTVALGAHLHIVTVTTVASTSADVLTEGVIYRYDLAFVFDDNVSFDLATATRNAQLAYAPLDRPSFCLPPADINDLRVLFGSCRIPHGHGKDAFPVADDLIAQTAGNATARPHQLLLTGDQIYADDVASAMLMMLTDASNVLLDWKEVLPVDAKYGGPQPGDRLSPRLRREPLEDAGFTSEDLDAQLMTLGEYVCMYLFVWSDVLWPTDMPAFNDVIAAGHANISDPNTFARWFADRLHQGFEAGMKQDAVQLDLFRGGLVAVRRLLANIPSYMILDDHEVTDDFNMTRDFCKNVYGHDLGVRVIQNGLVAYALCQHWGNAPEQFDRLGAATDPPGQALLSLLDRTNETKYAANAAALQKLVGVHDDTALEARGDKSVFHDADSILYNFTVEGPAHQVIFTDTRTWRSFPRGNNGGGDLLTTEQMVEQIVKTPPTGDRALIVIFTTNVPPVEPIRSATRHDFIANLFEHYPDVYEAWELPSVAFDRLMVALSKKLPTLDGSLSGPLVILSGDVHFSFASRLLYKAKTRFEDTQPQSVTTVVAQLVGSSLRKQSKSTLGFQRDGYEFGPSWIARLMIPKRTPEGYVGWNTVSGSELQVGQKGHEIGSTWIPLLTLTLDQPTLPISPDGLFLGVAIDPATPPDYSYRLDYLLPTKDGIPPAQPTPIPPLPAGATPDQRQQAAAAFHLATGQYRRYNAGSNAVSKVIGVNNICEITFDWDPADPRKRKVNHTVRWRGSTDDGSQPSGPPAPPGDPPVQFTDYVVSFDPDDSDFAELIPRAMP